MTIQTHGPDQSATSQNKARWRQDVMLAAGVTIISLFTLFFYRGILFTPLDQPGYPWSSDALGHVLKAEYLQREIAQGHFYPDLLPSWYMGVQMMRYYPPLPYYLLGVRLNFDLKTEICYTR